MIRVLLAEDQTMVREALASLLALEDDIEVVAQVGRGDEVLAAARAERPDVALLDIEMPGATGSTRPAAARGAAGHARGHPHDVQPARLPAARDGAGRVRLPAQGRAGRRARGGDPRASSPASGSSIPGLAAAALVEGESPLTAREHEVLDAARRHGTVAELAAALHLSPGTTRNHLSAIMGKLGAHSRIEAIRVAEEKGWL